jgi:methionyl aminopeptidase
MNIYSAGEIAILKEGGQILSETLKEIAGMAASGVTTKELNDLAEKRIRAAGGVPSFLGYRSDRHDPPFPGTVCMSLNDEVVHGFPSKEPLRDGDLVKMDIGMRYKGLCTDMACTVPVGKVSAEATKLARVTLEALRLAIKHAQPGGFIADIGKAVERHVESNGFSVVEALVGHGVGHAVHEDPPVPNYWDKHAEPVRIVPGMVLALEPMVNAGHADVYLKEDRWTVATRDHRLSAHYEATIAITALGPELVTPIVVGPWPEYADPRG